MKEITTAFAWLGALAILTAFLAVWFWFICRRPDRWASWVDRENDFWVRKGIISASFSQEFRRLEKGIVLKLLVGGGALIGTLEVFILGFLLLRIAVLKH